VAHKLIIIVTELKVESKPEWVQYLRFGEVIRGEPFTVLLTVKNLADTNFPGGRIKSMKVRFASLETGVTQEKSIPTLSPGAESTLQYTFTVNENGTGWLVLAIEANDQQPIEYYQTPEFKVPGTEWMYHIYSVDREKLQIVALLARLAK